MTSHQLVQALRSLTLSSRISSCTLITKSQPRSFLHTTSVCQRRLDSRRYPRNEEPSSNGRWEPMKKISELHAYTTEPIPLQRYGGRGPNGKIWNHKRGGGDKRVFYMIDWERTPSELTTEKPLVERVTKIQQDQNRTGLIALVASGDKKRWIVATQNMKEGDLITSSKKVTHVAVKAKEGDSHPLGSLPIGTLVNCVEKYPGDGGHFARAAGVSALLVRKTGDTCLVRLPSKREVVLSHQCIATVGRISNVDHNKKKFRKFGEKRWLGIRPRSGRWHRKTGRFGRKIKRPKAPIVYDQRPPPKQEVYRFTY